MNIVQLEYLLFKDTFYTTKKDKKELEKIKTLYEKNKDLFLEFISNKNFNLVGHYYDLLKLIDKEPVQCKIAFNKLLQKNCSLNVFYEIKIDL